MHRDDFARIAEEAYAALPEALTAKIVNAAFVIEDEPSERQYQENGVPDDEDLLGLYEGTPLVDRGIDHLGLPDKIYLFQLPIEDAAEEDGLSVYDVIYDTLLHEIGHHLGLDEDEVERVERLREERGNKR